MHDYLRMTLFQSIILGIIQGVTEFVPVSSSGHLVLFEELLGLETKELLSFDIMVHGATLLVLLIYFRNDWLSMGRALFSKKDPQSRSLFLFLIIAMIPAGIIGVAGRGFFELMRDAGIVFILMIITGQIFLLAEFFTAKKASAKMAAVKSLTWKRALIIGLFQAIALFPGVSRSGATMAGAMFTGQSRVNAARFSFLLGAIAIAGATAISLPDFFGEGINGISFGTLAAGFVAAFVAGYVSIDFLMKFLRTHTLKGFAIYLIGVGFLGLVV